MAKLIADNWWLSDLAASTPTDYKIQDGSNVSMPWPVRYADQRGSGDMAAQDKPTGLETDNEVSVTLLVDQTEFDELWALHGTKVGTSAPWGIVDTTGGTRTTICSGEFLLVINPRATVGDNVTIDVTLRCQGMPTVPDLDHLDTSA